MARRPQPLPSSCCSERRRHWDPAAVAPARRALAGARMGVATVRAARDGGRWPVVREERAEQDVLRDGQLAKDLGDVHLDHAAVHLVPRLDGRDVVEHRGVPAQGRGFDLHRVGSGGTVQQTGRTELMNWMQAKYM